MTFLDCAREAFVTLSEKLLKLILCENRFTTNVDSINVDVEGST